MISLTPPQKLGFLYITATGALTGLLSSILGRVISDQLAPIFGRNIVVAGQDAEYGLIIILGVFGIMSLVFFIIPLVRGVSKARETGQYIRYLAVAFIAAGWYPLSVFMGLNSAHNMFVMPLIAPIVLSVLIGALMLLKRDWADAIRPLFINIPLVLLFTLTFLSTFTAGAILELDNKMTHSQKETYGSIQDARVQMRCQERAETIRRGPCERRYVANSTQAACGNPQPTRSETYNMTAREAGCSLQTLVPNDLNVTIDGVSISCIDRGYMPETCAGFE